MGLTINDRKAADMASKITVDRRLWLTADGKLVEDGDPKAAFLWAGEGREVRADEAERLGYRPSRTKAQPPAEEPADGDGQDAPEVDADAEPPQADGNEEPDPLACDLDGCDFVAKNAGGLKRHRRSHS